MQAIGCVGGAEVLVDRSGHRPVVVVREGPPWSGLAWGVAMVLSGVAMPGSAVTETSEGERHYDYRIPWDEEVEGRVGALVDVLMGLRCALHGPSVWPVEDGVRVWYKEEGDAVGKPRLQGGGRVMSGEE